MKVLWCCLLLSLTGCITVPNKLIVTPEALPTDIGREIVLSVTGKNADIANRLRDAVSKGLAAQKVQTASTAAANLSRIDIEVKERQVNRTAYVEGNTTYYVESDRLELVLRFYLPEATNPYFHLETALDSQVKGIARGGYQEKEDLDSLLLRTGHFAALLYANIQKGSVAGLERKWQDILGGARIRFIRNDQGSGYVAVIEALQGGNIGFAKDDEAYRIDAPMQNATGIGYDGLTKVNFVNRKAAWVPSTFSIYGCLLIVVPKSAVGKSFFVSDCASGSAAN